MFLLTWCFCDNSLRRQFRGIETDRDLMLRYFLRTSVSKLIRYFLSRYIRSETGYFLHNKLSIVVSLRDTQTRHLWQNMQRRDIRIIHYLSHYPKSKIRIHLFETNTYFFQWSQELHFSWLSCPADIACLTLSSFTTCLQLINWYVFSKIFIITFNAQYYQSYKFLK